MRGPTIMLPVSAATHHAVGVARAMCQPPIMCIKMSKYYTKEQEVMSRLSKFLVADALVFSLAGCGDSPMLRSHETLVDPCF